jgi:hypothetical protein
MRVKLDDLFNEHVRRWVESWAAANPQHEADADLLVGGEGTRGILWERLPPDVPLRLASALHRKALVTELEDPPASNPTSRRGHFIGPPGMAKHQMLTNHEGRAWPCWEMFVHMAEYGSLHAMATEYDALDLQIEDDLMDLTVRTDGALIAYTEVKRKVDEARSLIDGMRNPRAGDLELRRAYLQGEITPRAVPDAIKKAGYLLRASKDRPATLPPIAFAVRAGGPEDALTFLVRPDHHTMEIVFEVAKDPLPLHVERSVQTDPHRRAQACLAWTLQRQSCVLLRRGKHGNYVIYNGTTESTPIAVAFERKGAVYSELHAFTDAQREAMVRMLTRHGVTLGDTSTGKHHRMWKNATSNNLFILDDEALARQLGDDLAEVLRS